MPMTQLRGTSRAICSEISPVHSAMRRHHTPRRISTRAMASSRLSTTSVPCAPSLRGQLPSFRTT